MIEKIKTIAIIIMAIAIITFVYELFLQKNNHEQQVIELNTKLSISSSTLLETQALADKYRRELDNLPPPVIKIIKEKELAFKSRDKSTFAVSGAATTGTQEATSTEKVTKYTWTDNLGRFSLLDVDISTPNNETFTYNQHFTIKGMVFKNKDGTVQLRRVELAEVYKGPDGTFSPVKGSSTALVDSKFEYESDIISKSIWDIWHPRAIVGVGVGADLSPKPIVGAELANLGNYINYANVGVNLHVKPDWEATQIGTGITYNPLKPLIDTNLSLGISLSTPSNNLAKQWNLSVDAVFYLTN